MGLRQPQRCVSRSSNRTTNKVPGRGASNRKIPVHEQGYQCQRLSAAPILHLVTSTQGGTQSKDKQPGAMPSTFQHCWDGLAVQYLQYKNIVTSRDRI